MYSLGQFKKSSELGRYSEQLLKENIHENFKNVHTILKVPKKKNTHLQKFRVMYMAPLLANILNSQK